VLGAALAALSAASFGLNNAMTRRGVLTGSVGQALAIGVPIGIPMFFLFALIGGGLGAIAHFSRDVLVIIAATGILHFICGRYCNYRSVKAVGANVSGPVVQLSLLVSLFLAITALDEGLTPLRVVGIVLVILGPALMHRTDATPTTTSIDPAAAAGGRSVAAGPPPFQPRYAEGYVFGLLAAACYGVTPILIRVVTEHGSLADSMAAGLLSNCAATAIIALLLLWPGQLRHILSIDPTPAKWFIASGLLVTISQMFLYLALTVAPVSVVMPILQLHLAFRYLLGCLMNPHHEVHGAMMILAIGISIIGATALSLDPEFAIAHLALPEPLIALLRWKLM
jgi:drug/metabolite transporter (DMT)-like permease